MSDTSTPFNQQNWLDKAIAYVAPKIAVQRMAQRVTLALGGGYTGAKLDSSIMNRWMPRAGSPTADISRDLPMLRARSRDQMRNAPVALGALNTTVSHVVGTGLSYTPAVDGKFLGLTAEQLEEWSADTKRRFDAWAISLDVDLSRRLNFYGIQELGLRTMLESGDTICITPRVARNGGPTRLALQLVEADRVCNPSSKPNSADLVDGIELDPTTGETLAMHVARTHPGDVLGTVTEWLRVPMRGDSTGRRNVLHMFKVLRPGQVRGVPMIAPILEPLKQLSRWTDAELNAAVVSSLFSVFVKMDPDAFDEMFDEGTKTTFLEKASNWSGELESGQAVNLLPGEDIVTTQPGRPNPAFDPFWAAIVRQIGMALEMPYEVLTMHFQSSYSAARAALLMAWKAFRSRRDMLSTYLCQPVFELWLDDEVAEGRISAPGYFASELVRAAWRGAIWTGDGPGSIDPSKEVDAAQKRVDMGISTKEAESILHDGVSWRPKHEQRIKEVQAERAAGIYFAPAGRTATAEPAPDSEDAPPVPPVPKK
jgi:lambda family phage portal protein